MFERSNGKAAQLPKCKILFFLTFDVSTKNPTFIKALKYIVSGGMSS